MPVSRDPDRLVHAYLQEGPTELADQVYDAVRAEIDQRRQHAAVGWWTGSFGIGAAAAVAVALVVVSQLLGPRAPGVGTVPTAMPSATAAPSSAAPSTSITPDDLVNGFLEARVDGAGAQPYLADVEADIPLLYASSSGAAYAHGEFERVPGIEWPYGLTAFKVRMTAEETVVEQLFFIDLASRRPRLSYEVDGFGTDIAPTTEDGRPVAAPYEYYDGGLTLHAAHPWVFHDAWAGGRLIPEGPDVAPTTDGGQRHDWDHLELIADPVGTDCRSGVGTAGAEELAAELRAHPDLEATDPVAVSVRRTEALMMDVVVTAGTSICDLADAMGNPRRVGVLSPLLDTEGTVRIVDGLAYGSATSERMRLYLIDVPAGSPMRTLAVAIVAAESSFERAAEAAAPVVESMEFHVP